MYSKNDSQLFHDNPPSFKASDRKKYFYIDEQFGRQVLALIRGDNNKVFISVAYGYFRATGQFFDTADQADINYVANKFKFNQSFKWDEYRSNTRDRHRQSILEVTGFTAFQHANINLLQTLIKNFARSQKNPSRCFEEACEWLFQHKVETPDYATLKKTIDTVYENHLAEQVDKIDSHLKESDRLILDQLLEKNIEDSDQWQTHKINLLKKFQQSVRPMKVKENIESFDLLKPLYEISKPIIDRLDFTQDGLKRYANQVSKKQVFQIKRLKDPHRFLYLSAFIAHKFSQLEDILVDTLISATTSARNEVEKKVKEEYYRQRNAQSQHTEILVNDTKNLLEIIQNLKDTFDDPLLNDTEKVQHGRSLIFQENIHDENITVHVNDVKEDLQRVSGQALTMKGFEDISLKLQRKCNDIVLRLEFSCSSSCESLQNAILRFKQTLGKIDNKYSLDFLSESERSFVETNDGINKPLYKVLLFMHIADAVKSDSISVSDSYKYKNLDKYLISPERWAADRLYLLTQANMLDFSDAEAVFNKCKLEVDAQYNETNDHLLQNTNEYVEADGSGGYKLTSERNTIGENLALFEKFDTELFPEDILIPIAEAMNTVNQATNFISEFEHQDHAYVKERPENRIFYAGVIGLGSHIGTKKLVKHSPIIKNSTLASTINAYFTLENVQRANDAIIHFVNKLPLSQLYETEYGMQTSSDGQKWRVSKDSFNANYSFKYGGKDMVIAEYSFTDGRGLFPYSTVFSGSDREAHYLIDGLLKNETVKSDMHSTDTHGYTEAVFGMTHILQFSFAPRIKNVQKQLLYSFKYPSVYKKKKFIILPEKRIDEELLNDHWEDILRLVASVKLGEVTASQIFKRLNSYSAAENSLYQALKEFGRIPKTLYILRYVDDPDLRKAVHKQLNKGESGNRLNKALAIGRLEYSQTLKEDQELAECCKRLLKNIVVCWNFMFISQKLLNAKTELERSAILKKAKNSSLLAWEHFMFHGEFDFSDSKLQDSQRFDFKGMTNPLIVKDIGE